MKVDELLERVITPWEIDNVDVKQMIALLNKHCKASLEDIQSGNVLYRGFVSTGKLGYSKPKIADSSTGERTSRDTNNLYHLMMDASKHLKSVPPRSKSFICSGSATDAGNYGDIFAVIPFDGVPVAVANHYDFLFQKLSTIGRTLDSKWLDSQFAELLSQEYGVHAPYRDIETINVALSKGGPALFMAILVEYDIFRAPNTLTRKRWSINQTYERLTGTDLDAALGMSSSDSRSGKHTLDKQALDTSLEAGLSDRGRELYAKLKADPRHMFEVLASEIYG